MNCIISQAAALKEKASGTQVFITVCCVTENTAWLTAGFLDVMGCILWDGKPN